MVKFKIESLNCMSCYHNIEDALKDFDPNIIAKADVRSKTLTVESNQSIELLSQLIEKAGYPISSIEKS